MTRTEHLNAAMYYTNLALIWSGEGADMDAAARNVEHYKVQSRWHLSFVREGN